MTYPFPPDVQKALDNYVAAGTYSNQDDVLRDALRALQDQRSGLDEDDPVVIEGIRRGLEEVSQGLCRPFEEFDAELRAKHKLDRNE